MVVAHASWLPGSACWFLPGHAIRERPFHYLGGGAGRVVFSRLFFHLMFKAGFFFHTPVEARFFFHKELKVRLFFYSHVSSQRYSHYFQGWGKIIFFATYQSKKIFSTYRLGQIIFLGQKQRQIIFSKTLPAPPPDNEMVAPLLLFCRNVLVLETAVKSHTLGRFIKRWTITATVKKLITWYQL